LHLFRRQHVDFLAANRRRVDQGRDVLVNHSPLRGVAQHPVNDTVHVKPGAIG
jgi:hypothetical protein